MKNSLTIYYGVSVYYINLLTPNYLYNENKE